ncbi:unnamed protein product, partial [Rotaria sordida]
MGLLNCIFLLLIMFTIAVDLMPFKDTGDKEIHKFRWAKGAHLQNTTCATAITPPQNPKTSLEVEIWNNAFKYIVFGAVSAEDVAEDCRSNSSLFVLMGNP